MFLVPFSTTTLFKKFSSALYLEIVEEISEILRSYGITILLIDFNAPVGNDVGVWRGTIRQHGNVDARK